MKDTAATETAVRLIVRSYSIVTPESAAQGDHAEYGWADFSGNRFAIQDEDGHHEKNIHTDFTLIGHDCTPDESDVEDGLSPVDIAVRFLQDDCYISQPSSTRFHVGVWYSSASETDDWADGSDVTYDYHLKGFTPDEEQAIYNRLFPRYAR